LFLTLDGRQWLTSPQHSAPPCHILIKGASCMGRRNPIKSVDPTVLFSENRSDWLCSIITKQDSVAFESTLANDFSL
jgi:hypothetical protein